MSEVIVLDTHIWLWYVNGNFDREVLRSDYPHIAIPSLVRYELNRGLNLVQ